jgi:hypothetical protein
VRHHVDINGDPLVGDHPVSALHWERLDMSQRVIRYGHLLNYLGFRACFETATTEHAVISQISAGAFCPGCPRRRGPRASKCRRRSRNGGNLVLVAPSSGM